MSATAVRKHMDQAGHELVIRFSKGTEAICDLCAWADRYGARVIGKYHRLFATSGASEPALPAPALMKKRSANIALGPSASLVIADVLRCSFPRLDVRERKGKVRVQCKIWSCEYRVADGRMCSGIAERHPAAGRDGQCDEHYRDARPTHRAGVRDCGKTVRLFCRRWW